MVLITGKVPPPLSTMWKITGDADEEHIGAHCDGSAF